ncbi:MAG: MmgE/PrpD family protein, partial [Candidatus Rokubacteria bacterium]|nr:MmgE/PrpD family protein [Candidatus Rokubacteria bacterium]
MGATARLAEFVVKSRWEELPGAAIEQVKRAILDSVGVMLAGSAEPPARIVQRVAEAEGGAPLCTVLGTQMRTGGVWAALANGTAGHALDFDDTNFALLGHPSVPLLSAALAAAELALADGRALIHAFLLGFEVETTLAEVMNPAHYARGWHATSTLGTLGAAAASAKLLGLDPAESRHALAIAASQASGLKENFGTMTKPFHAGHAARSGLLAALLAREGFTGSAVALEGAQGYLRLLGSQSEEPAAALERLGSPWKILTTGVAVKPYPSCACTHSIIAALLELRQTRALRPETVAEVTVGVNALVPNILIHHQPRTGLEGKFSAEFCAAAALVDGRVGIATFTDERTADPAIRSLMGRVKMEVDPTIAGDLEHHVWSRVRVRLADGRALEIPPREVLGHPAAPLSRDALLAKFTDCASRVLAGDRVESMAEMLDELEGCPDLRSLTAILRP